MASWENLHDHGSIDSDTLLRSVGIAAASGVALHVFYFRQSEHHMYGVKYLQAALALFAGAIFCLVRFLSVPPRAAFDLVSIHGLACLAGIYASLITYRLFFHPLRRFPGPFWARLTSLWFSTQLKNADAHKQMLELHRNYGHFVRIGSSDLSITHPKGVQAVYGPGSACRKATWYDEDWPRSSIHTSRDHTFHGQRRRIWSPAFSDKALRGYEPRIQQYNESLVSQMKKLAGQPVNVTHWLNYYSFDVMGDLAFDKDFGMLASGESHWAVSLLNEAMALQGLKLPTWIFRMLLAIPGLAHKYWKFIAYCDEQLDNRMKRRSEASSDVMATLLSAAKHEPGKQMSPNEDLTLRSDSRTIIVAGSDTTAASLTHIFYYIAKEPSVLNNLQTELAELQDDGADIDNKKLLKADYLNAVINETLRLHPVVPSAVTRKTPPQGIMVGETFVPGNMTVWCPQFVISRDEDNYARANEFIPERWSSKPELIKDSGGYAPFSIGKSQLFVSTADGINLPEEVPLTSTEYRNLRLHRQTSRSHGAAHRHRKSRLPIQHLSCAGRGWSCTARADSRPVHDQLGRSTVAV